MQKLDPMQRMYLADRENSVIPETVLKAERILKSDYSILYLLINNYRNSRFIEYPDLVKIQVHTAIAGFPWEKYGKLIMRFVNADEKKIESDFIDDLPEPVDSKPEKVETRGRNKWFKSSVANHVVKERVKIRREKNKLTPNQRKLIRDDPRSHRTIAKEYGVSYQAVLYWKHREKYVTKKVNKKSECN